MSGVAGGQWKAAQVAGDRLARDIGRGGGQGVGLQNTREGDQRTNQLRALRTRDREPPRKRAAIDDQKKSNAKMSSRSDTIPAAPMSTCCNAPTNLLRSSPLSAELT